MNSTITCAHTFLYYSNTHEYISHIILTYINIHLIWCIQLLYIITHIVSHVSRCAFRGARGRRFSSSSTPCPLRLRRPRYLICNDTYKSERDTSANTYNIHRIHDVIYVQCVYFENVFCVHCMYFICTAFAMCGCAVFVYVLYTYTNTYVSRSLCVYKCAVSHSLFWNRGTQS